MASPNGQGEVGEPHNTERANESNSESKPSWPARIFLPIRNHFRHYREKANDPDRRKNRREWLTVLGVLLAAAFAAGQWYELSRTDDTLRKQLKQMELAGKLTDELIAANKRLAEAAGQQAKTAAQQYEAGFKPWLIVRMGGPYIDPAQDSLQTIPPNRMPRWIPIRVSVEIENITDMPAIITKSSLTVVNLIGGDLELTGTDRQEDIFEILTKGGKFYPLRIGGNAPEQYNIDELKNVVVGTFKFTDVELRRRLFRWPLPIVGKIEYSDPLGKQRELGFGFVPHAFWSPQGFKRWGGREYNYDREIKQ